MPDASHIYEEDVGKDNITKEGRTFTKILYEEPIVSVTFYCSKKWNESIL